MVQNKWGGYMFFKRLFLITVCFILVSGFSFSLEPMTKEMLQKYKNDETLAIRIEKAKAFGNHKMPKGSGAYLNYKLKKIKYNTSSNNSELMKLSTPPTGWRNMPTTGDVNVLVLLVEFQDYPHYTDKTEVENKVFGTGNQDDYPYESLRNYYDRSSYNQLNFQGDVLGWYSAPYNRSAVVESRAGRETLIKEIITYYDGQGVDFSKYDNDKDGSIDYFAIVWTGPHEDWAEFWWGYQTFFSDYSFVVDGVRLAAYSWQWENRSYPDVYDPNATGLEFIPTTLIHETGHALGLPDYYDYDGSVGPVGGVGGLDIMDATWGDHNCFSKFVLDWVAPAQIITEGEHQVTLKNSEDNDDFILIMPNYSGNTPFSEFFMVQYRKREGNDATYPNDGLTIWHVDATLDNYGYDYLFDNSYTEHKLLRLMEADGMEEIEQNQWADAGDFYTKNSLFSPETSPNSDSYAGDRTGITISEIGDTSEDISFNLKIQGIMSYLSHFDVTDTYWQSKLSISNGGLSSANLNLNVYDNNGVLYGTEEVTVPALGGFSQNISDIFSFSVPDQGYVEVESDSNMVKGVLSVKYISTGGETSLSLTYDTGKEQIFPLIDNSNGKATGIVILNPSIETNQVTLDLYDYLGVKQGSKLYTLNAKQKLVAMTSDIFGESLINQGFIKVTSEREATGFALTFTDNNQNIIAIPSNFIADED